MRGYRPSVHSLGIALLAVGATYLIAVAVWTGGIIPFSRRAAARRGEPWDYERARYLSGYQLLVSIAAVLIGLGLVASH
jgi:putative copper export protein